MLAGGFASSTFHVNFQAKRPFSNVHVQVDCAGWKEQNSGQRRNTFLGNVHTTWFFSNVHVRFNRAGAHKMCFPVLGSVFRLNTVAFLLFTIHIIIIPSSSPSSSSSPSPAHHNSVTYLMKSENISTDMCEITSSGTLKTAKILRGIHLMRATGLFIMFFKLSTLASEWLIKHYLAIASTWGFFAIFFP